MKALKPQHYLSKLRFRRAKGLVFVAAFAAIGVILLFVTRAATPYASIEPETGQLSRTDLAVTDSTASGGQAVRFGAVATTAPDKPGLANTGPSNSGILKSSGSLTITTEGAVIENVDISGTVKIQAHNVTLRNFRINANGASYGIQATYGFSGATIEDGEIYNIVSAGIYGGGFTARRLEIHESGGDAVKPTANVTFERSWMHHLGKNVGSHADVFQSRQGGSNMFFRYNNCDIPINEKGGPGDPYKSNACFIMEPDGGQLTNTVIENNWLNGGNYTVYCSGMTGVNVRNNRIGRAYRYGVKSNCPVWSGNVWDDTGEVIP